ncbi:electron transport complex protein RnfG [Mesocricetibacter intestinalis]|uniref:Ion-translocating oxidoreductase complex subunit G n=1 Tax=Mesocricetibacter intestinalis TaxID=1521930 RepID=A0A4R6VAX1_9PAST|nr:electron transport complex subunit RsxG [Mesocricetibacter intestinalis]TDQ59117.1 electron transport complex protein RnfG [Mesocricetibacter intestinalis]
MGIMKTTSKYAFLLALVALICATLSSAIHFLTKDKVEEVIARQQQELLLQVIPQRYFDNDLLSSCVRSDNPQFGKIYIAEQRDKISAYAFETTAPDGYSGNIRLLVGITPAGEVLGVRVIEHHETPGLGDKIELRISHWILSFNNKKISADNLSDWAVKKDGGKFDQFSGATITPRAIVNQVKRAALMILEQPPKTEAGCE